jgi:glutamyl-tRNA synthetase
MGKLSKRDGDKMGFPVFPLLWNDPATGELFRGYREDGYFPEAFINLLALLGWNPGTEQEFFTLEELTALFSIDRVVKSGSRFDPEKAKWFNRHYFQQKEESALADAFRVLLQKRGITAGNSTVEKVVAVIKERCTFVSDLWEQGSFFFVAPGAYDEKTVRKKWKEDTPAMLTAIAEELATVKLWEAEAIKEAFSAFVNAQGWSFGMVMPPLRICLVGDNVGPDLFTIFEIVGKEASLARIDTALQKIGSGH